MAEGGRGVPGGHTEEREREDSEADVEGQGEGSEEGPGPEDLMLDVGCLDRGS